MNWNPKDICIRFSTQCFENRAGRYVPNVLETFVVMIMPDGKEICLYEFDVKLPRIYKQEEIDNVKYIIGELGSNNARCLITNRDDENLDEVRDFAKMKMKNFSNVNLTLDMETLPFPYNFDLMLRKGVDVKKIEIECWRELYYRKDEPAKANVYYPDIQQYMKEHKPWKMNKNDSDNDAWFEIAKILNIKKI